MSLKIDSVTKIYADGRHNAFTNICAFEDRIFVTFRNATLHTECDGRIKVLSSTDGGTTWEPFALLEPSHRNGDLRDPRLAVFNEKLHLFTGERVDTKYHFDYEPLHYIWDGEKFTKDEFTGLKPNSCPWSPLVVGNKIYLAAQVCSPNNDKCYFYVSEDTRKWKLLTQFPPGNETALTFDARKKSIIALVRNPEIEPWHPTLCTLNAPDYNQVKIERVLPLRLQGIMLDKIDDGLIIIGRTWDLPRKNMRICIYKLRDEDGCIEEVNTLPSGGDCSYSSILRVNDSEALITYYSAHEWLQNYVPQRDKTLEHSVKADVFLAKVAFLHKQGSR